MASLEKTCPLGRAIGGLSWSMTSPMILQMRVDLEWKGEGREEEMLTPSFEHTGQGVVKRLEVGEGEELGLDPKGLDGSPPLPPFEDGDEL